MVLRLFAFAAFVFALGTLVGDAARSFLTGEPFGLRSAGEWWVEASPVSLDLARTLVHRHFGGEVWERGVVTLLTMPAPVLLAGIGALMLAVVGVFTPAAAAAALPLASVALADARKKPALPLHQHRPAEAGGPAPAGTGADQPPVDDAALRPGGPPQP